MGERAPERLGWAGATGLAGGVFVVGWLVAVGAVLLVGATFWNVMARRAGAVVEAGHGESVVSSSSGVELREARWTS